MREPYSLRWSESLTGRKKTPLVSWPGLSRWKAMGSMFSIAPPPNFFLYKKICSPPFAVQGFACGLSWLQTLKLQFSADPKWADLCWRNTWQPILYFLFVCLCFLAVYFRSTVFYYAIFLVWRLFQKIFFFFLNRIYKGSCFRGHILENLCNILVI